MNQRVRSVFQLCVTAAALLIGVASNSLAQDQGTITGRVIEANSNAPVASVQLQVVGTTRGAVTGEDGRFRIAGD